MKYDLIISEDAEKDFLRLRKSGEKAAILKLNDLLNELREHPYTGTGKPKPLGYNRAGQWSRRITDKHRLVYSVDEGELTVLVISTSGHYNDK